jgi:hypothetical protein
MAGQETAGREDYHVASPSQTDNKCDDEEHQHGQEPVICDEWARNVVHGGIVLPDSQTTSVVFIMAIFCVNLRREEQDERS